MIEFLRNLIIRDFWLKLFSLVLATLIWLTVWTFAIRKDVSPLAAFSESTSEQVYFNIPVLVKLPAADVREFRVNPSTVQVTVQGDPKLLYNLKAQHIQAEVNLTGIESARGLRQRIEVILPPGVRYTRLVPEEVEVVIPPRK